MRARPVELLGVILASLAFAATFNRARASTRQDKIICASPRLSQLDDQLAAAYSKLLAIVPTDARAAVRQSE